MACKAYWNDQGGQNVCNEILAAGANYGYIPSSDVTLSGTGDETNFVATGVHVDSTISYSINDKGQIY